MIKQAMTLGAAHLERLDARRQRGLQLPRSILQRRDRLLQRVALVGERAIPFVHLGRVALVFELLLRELDLELLPLLDEPGTRGVQRLLERASDGLGLGEVRDRKSTRLNSSHSQSSYAVF